MKYKKRNGVPKGYKHSWQYNGQWNEKKTGPGTWKFRFRALKGRKGSSKGGLPKGSTIKWYIKGVQTAKKVGGRQYMTDFKGTKKLIGKRIKRRVYNT